MNCLKFRQQASLYIDRQLDSAANQEFLFHLNSCSGCFEYVDEIRNTAQLLKQLGHSMPPENLAIDILAKMGNTKEQKPREIMARLRNFTLYSRPQYVAYATSFLLTCLLFVSILYDLKPSFRLPRQIENGFISVIDRTPPINEVRPINETLPSVQSANAIVELSFQNNHQMPTKDLFVVAEVTTEGRAKLIELVDGPKNPQLERNVDAALKRASFKPATKDGRPVKSRMYLLIQTIDVRG
jgi:hypothetical protein